MSLNMGIFFRDIDLEIQCIKKINKIHSRLGFQFGIVIILLTLLIVSQFQLILYLEIIAGIILLIFFFITLFYYCREKKEIDELWNRMKNKISPDDENKATDIDELITKQLKKIFDINFDNLNEYYRLNGEQVKNSFYFGIGMSAFGVICFFIAIVYFVSYGQGSISTISGVTGIVSELYSAFILYFYIKSHEFRKNHEISMVEVQYLLVSWKLVDKIKKEEDNDDIRKLVDICLRKIR